MCKEYPIQNISRLRMGSDGDGVRALITLYGCPLRCRYCINPHTWDGSLLPVNLTAEEIYKRVSVDRLYILATNGGITFGGGEPLLYPGLISEMRGLCDPEMTIYVETSLHVPWENIEASLDAVDRYFVDIKTMDAVLYKEYTGMELDLSLENLKRLLERKPVDSIVVRIPIIPGMADENKQEETRAKLYDIGIRRFDLFTYVISDSKHLHPG